MRRPDRSSEDPGRRRRLIRPVAVVVWLSVALGACAPGPSPSSPAPAINVPGASVDPAPGWALHLLSQLQCRDGPAPAGHERNSEPPVGHEGTSSPYRWLESIDDPDLPLDGYVIDPETPWEGGQSHFTRHVYRVGGAIKALILMEGTSTQGGPGSWDVTAWQACRPSEFDPADGRTSDDAPFVDVVGRAASDVRTIAGPGHCGWQSTVWLYRGDALYLRDPDGVLRAQAVRPYAEPKALPVAASDSGIHSVRWRVFTSPDRDVALMVAPDGGVEAWPRAKDPEMGCA